MINVIPVLAFAFVGANSRCADLCHCEGSAGARLLPAQLAAGHSVSVLNAAASAVEDIATTASTVGHPNNDRNVAIQALLDGIQDVGQVGSVASQEDRLKIEELAKAVIKTQTAGTADSAVDTPARYPLTGTHTLLYSASPKQSSGGLFGGKIVGRVTQRFDNETTFYNKLRIGVLEIELRANREVKNDKLIAVKFDEMTISLFGKTVKKSPAGGGGSWRCLFADEVNVGGQRKILRIMQTPSLFVLEQPLDGE
mmetsp:Transcript_12343/g.33954  ORF Transcript_12343/g.33954 Transcript_12343/m.33954 type:complete len:254 (-) Transcript_12343:59-820(-)